MFRVFQVLSLSLYQRGTTVIPRATPDLSPLVTRTVTLFVKLLLVTTISVYFLFRRIWKKPTFLISFVALHISETNTCYGTLKLYRICLPGKKYATCKLLQEQFKIIYNTRPSHVFSLSSNPILCRPRWSSG